VYLITEGLALVPEAETNSVTCYKAAELRLVYGTGGRQDEANMTGPPRRGDSSKRSSWSLVASETTGQKPLNMTRSFMGLSGDQVS
jgi:hypothetical protein